MAELQRNVQLFIPLHRFGTKTPRILILGSFPSVKSRETNFFYGPSAEPLLARACPPYWAVKSRKVRRRKKRFLLSKPHCGLDVIGRL